MITRKLVRGLSGLTALAGATALAVGLFALDAPSAFADEGGGGKGRQGAGAGHAGGGHGGGAKGMGGSRGSMRGMFRDLTGADTDDDDSDRPEWAGRPGGPTTGGGRPDMAGSKRGDLFGDLWVILRDSNGVPILTPEGWVQPLDADGNLIPLDEEGHPVDEELTIEVELGRLNVGRAPSQVLDRRADEVIGLLMAATEISTDPSGRLVLTVDGETKTIDSPLENLAIYVALLSTGSIPGLTPDDLVGTEFDFMVDGVYDGRDLAASTAFIAAATDKTGVFTSDEIAYIDAFLGINTTKVGSVTYSEINYSGFSYDRSDTYSGVTADVLVLQPDGTYKVETVDLYDAVFGGVDASLSGSLDAYTQAADDARAVVNFIHEYEVPAETTTRDHDTEVLGWAGGAVPPARNRRRRRSR